MARKKPAFDDLDEMRKELDRLGDALGLGPKGKPTPRPSGAAAKSSAPKEPERPGKAAGPGAVLRNRMRKALGLSLLAMAAWAPSVQGKEAGGPALADSLGRIKVVIESEFRVGDSLFAIKDQRAADSLLRNIPDRGPLLQAIRDTALAREMRTKAEFDAYWERVQSSSGHKRLRGRLAAQDVDRTRVPRIYLFDSTVVVLPGWIVARKRSR